MCFTYFFSTDIVSASFGKEGVVTLKTFWGRETKKGGIFKKKGVNLTF